jgi:hypothetical protein
MYDINNWIRRDTQTTVVYYGYSTNENALDTDSNWSIMSVSSSGTVDTVKWSNGSTVGVSTWSNRVQSFQPPRSISLTYSVAASTYNTSISIGWSASAGVDKYIVKLVDQNGVIYSDSGYQIYNVNGNQAITSSIQNNNSYNYKFGKAGSTYLATVSSSNVAGYTSSVIKIVI